jgi:hypothetical protein
VQNTITITDNGGTANDVFAPVDADDKVEFTITLDDGCNDAMINPPSLSTYSLSVIDGDTDTITFTDAGDTFSVQISDVTWCGRREYEVQF